MTRARLLSTASRYDRSDLLGSIRRLPDQCAQALADTVRLRVPARYRRTTAVVVAGMGGSGLGAHLIQAAFADRLRVPFAIVNDYALPGWVDRRTLVIASSYSGSTEETLAAYAEARARGAALAVLATGGPLAKRARSDRIPAYVFTPTHNPARQPRMAVGYSAFGVLAFLRATGHLRVPAAELRAAIRHLRTTTAELLDGAGSRPVLQIAGTLTSRIPLLIGADHLAGSIHVAQNQIHENAKHVAVSFLLPELNHHLLEGLRFPAATTRLLHAVLVDSPRYHPRTRRRLAVTRDILRQQRIPSSVFTVDGPNRLAEALALVAHGSLLSFALAMRHRIDPSPVPWVEAFKRRLTMDGGHR